MASEARRSAAKSTYHVRRLPDLCGRMNEVWRLKRCVVNVFLMYHRQIGSATHRNSCILDVFFYPEKVCRGIQGDLRASPAANAVNLAL